ncbi:hypothetical protein RJT34_02094 [Clitoria ternatea]|uniref:Uncharacterized protein n=1 Tax=Clitoria ternatea TaxID=43366 RepID=A0AAN9KIA2_CLITE
MESDQVTSKDMKVQIPGSGVEFQGTPNVGQGGLTRQPSMTKTNCLCSPTTHAGSFRCRLHRSPSLQRTKSIESESLHDQPSTVHASLLDAPANATKDRVH